MSHDLRNAALDIFQRAMRAVDPREAVRKAVSLQGSYLRIGESQFDIATHSVYVVAIGKAAVTMTLGLHDILRDRVSQGVISSLPSDAASQLPSTYAIFTGGHPVPNQQSLDAAQATFKLLERANEDSGIVVFLVSGGGSAMLEWPISTDITLEDLQETHRKLVASGATIREINSVRSSISATKGGRLVTRAAQAAVVTLIVSDTNRGDESSVASGPTLRGKAPNALEVLHRFNLSSSVPTSVVSAIRNQENDTYLIESPYYVLMDNGDALWGAIKRAAELGFTTSIAADVNEQPVAVGATLLLERANAMDHLPACLLSGGEFSCRASGDGRGGRNLETVLRCAMELEQKKVRQHTVILSVGTDGIDGSSFAAGALADETTIARALELGLDAADYLDRSDSHAFFAALDDLIVTGPTGTNVRDMRIILRAKG